MDVENQSQLIKSETLKPKTNKKNRFLSALNSIVRNFIAIGFWAYVICQVFIFDIDGYLISKLPSSLIFIVKFKLVLILAALSIFWLLSKNKIFASWFFYIIFYPFILLFWILPIALYKLGNWNIAIAVINSFFSFFNSLKYNIIIFSFFIISSILLLSSTNKIIIVLSAILLFIVLVATFINRFAQVFKPSLIYRIHSKLVTKFLNFSKRTWAVEQELQELSIANMSDTQLQKWSTNLGSIVIANRICYFLSSKLSNYQKSRINVMFNVVSILLLLIFTVFCFALISFGFYKIYPNTYSLHSINPDFFAFFYYSFNALCFNGISEVVVSTNLARVIFMTEQFFALLLISVFFTLFLSIKNEREATDISEVVKKIKQQGDIMGEFIEAEYKLSVDDAIKELDRLKSGLIKVIFYLSKGIS